MRGIATMYLFSLSCVCLGIYLPRLLESPDNVASRSPLFLGYRPGHFIAIVPIAGQTRLVPLYNARRVTLPLRFVSAGDSVTTAAELSRWIDTVTVDGYLLAQIQCEVASGHAAVCDLRARYLEQAAQRFIAAGSATDDIGELGLAEDRQIQCQACTMINVGSATRCVVCNTTLS